MVVVISKLPDLARFLARIQIDLCFGVKQADREWYFIMQWVNALYFYEFASYFFLRMIGSKFLSSFKTAPEDLKNQGYQTTTVREEFITCENKYHLARSIRVLELFWWQISISFYDIWEVPGSLVKPDLTSYMETGEKKNER